MTNSPLWKVGKTQRTMFGVGGRHGFGFSVQDARGAPLLTISYATEEEAKEVEAILRKVLESAIDISKAYTRRANAYAYQLGRTREGRLNVYRAERARRAVATGFPL